LEKPFKMKKRKKSLALSEDPQNYEQIKSSEKKQRQAQFTLAAAASKTQAAATFA